MLKAHITHTRVGTPCHRTTTFISLSSYNNIQSQYITDNSKIVIHCDGPFRHKVVSIRSRVSPYYLLHEQYRIFHTQKININNGNGSTRVNSNSPARMGSVGLGRGRLPPSPPGPTRYSLASFNKGVSGVSCKKPLQNNEEKDTTLIPDKTPVDILKESQHSVLPSMSTPSSRWHINNSSDGGYLDSSQEEIEKAVANLMNEPDGVKKVTHTAVTQIAKRYQRQVLPGEAISSNTVADTKSSHFIHSQANINTNTNEKTPIKIAAEYVLIPLVERLIFIVTNEKCIQWNSFDEVIKALPAFSRRKQVMEAYHRQYDNCESNNEPHCKTTLIIKGDTGCGKSLIIPLTMLDYHWRGVLEGLERMMKELRMVVGLGDIHSTESFVDVKGLTTKGREECIVEKRDTMPLNFKVDFFLKDYFFPEDDKTSTLFLERFILDFTNKSRIRVCVAQPTRLASKSLAQFLNWQLSKTMPSCLKNKTIDKYSNGETLACKTDTKNSGESEEKRSLNDPTATAYNILPLGQRVGYASSLDRCMDYRTVEILFATSGYLLMTLAGTNNIVNVSDDDLVRDPITGANVKNNYYSNSLVGLSTFFGLGLGLGLGLHVNSTTGTRSFKEQQHQLTLIIDEAHRRDIQLDLLLSWAKHWMSLDETRQESSLVQSHSGIGHSIHYHQHHSHNSNRKQLVVMSASMDVEAYMDYFNKASNECSVTLRSAFLNLTPERNDVYAGDNDDSPRMVNNENISVVDVEQKQQPSIKYINAVLFGDDLNSIADIISSSEEMNQQHTKQDNRVSKPISSGEGRGINVSRSIALNILSKANPITLKNIQSVIEARSGQPFSPKKIRIASAATSVIPSGGELYELVARLSIDVVYNDKNVLVFVPGYTEIVLFMSYVSRINQLTGIINLSNHSEDATLTMDTDQPNSRSDSSFSSSMTFLKGGTLIVDVIALHSTVIGESVEQLEKSKAKAKIIVSTNVAESSVTVPNVTLVIDTCMERVSQWIRTSSPSDSNFNDVNGENLDRTKIITVPSGLTGVRGSLTARLASKSSLMQRRGRTGRTCNGCTIHLINRSVYETRCPEYTEVRWSEMENTTEKFILLTKLLFGSDTRNARLSFFDICCSLPGAPFKRDNPILLMKTIEEMIKNGLIAPPNQEKENSNVAMVGLGKDNLNIDADKMKEEWKYLNNCTLTVKGQFIAAIPIESTLGATLVFNGLLFDCMAETVVLAAAISSGVMINTATTYDGMGGEAKVISDGLYKVEAALHRRLELAADGISKNDEVWLSYLLAAKWYQLEGSNNEKLDFIDRFMLSRSMLARMDEIVIVTCTRLIQLLQASLDEDSKQQQQDAEGKSQRTAIFAFTSSATVRGSASKLDRPQTTKELLHQLFVLRTAAILNTMVSLRGRKPKGLTEVLKTTDLRTYTKVKSAFIATFLPRNYLLGSVTDNTSFSKSSNEMLSVSRHHQISYLENWVATSKNRQLLFHGMEETFHRNNTVPQTGTGKDDKIIKRHNYGDNNEFQDSSFICIFPLSLYIGAKKITSRTRLKLGTLTNERTSIIDDEFNNNGAVDLDESNTLTESDIFQCISEKNVREALSHFFRSSNFVKIETISFLSQRRVVVVKFSSMNSNTKGEDNDDDFHFENQEKFLLDTVPLERSIGLLKTTTIPEPGNPGTHLISPLRSVPFAAWLLRCLPAMMRESKVRISAFDIARRLNEKKVRYSLDAENVMDDKKYFQNNGCKESPSVTDHIIYVDVGEIFYEPIVGKLSMETIKETKNSLVDLKNDDDKETSSIRKPIYQDTSVYHCFYKYHNPDTQMISDEDEICSNIIVSEMKINLTKAEQLGYGDWIPSQRLLQKERSRRESLYIPQEVNEERQNSRKGDNVYRWHSRPKEDDVIVVRPISQRDNGNFGFTSGSQSQKISSASIDAYNLSDRIFLRFEAPIIPNSLRWKTASPFSSITAERLKSLDTSHIVKNSDGRNMEKSLHKATSIGFTTLDNCNAIVCPVCLFATRMREDESNPNQPNNVSIIPKGKITEHICTSLHHLEAIRTLINIDYDETTGISFKIMNDILQTTDDSEMVVQEDVSGESKETKPSNEIKSTPLGLFSHDQKIPSSSFFSPSYTPAACLAPILPSSLLYCDLRYSHLLHNPLYPLRTNPVGVAAGIVTQYHLIQHPSYTQSFSHQYVDEFLQSAPVVTTSLFSSATFMDLGYSREDCFLVLQATILNLSISRRDKINYSKLHLSSSWCWRDQPLLLLFNESHTKIYGFMVMGVLTCEIPPTNYEKKVHGNLGDVNRRHERGFFGNEVIQHFLSIKDSASSFATLARRDLSRKTTEEINSSFSVIQESTKSICVSKEAGVHGITLEGLRVMVGRGTSLAMAEGKQTDERTDSAGPLLTDRDSNHSVEERLHWCPLHSSCCTAYCERAANSSIRKALAKTEYMGGDNGNSGRVKVKIKQEKVRKSVLGSNWFPGHPVELLTSTQILILLNESWCIGRESYQMQHFYARLAHLVALKLKQQNHVDSDAQIRTSDGLNNVNVSNFSDSVIGTDVSQDELNAGEKVIDAFIKLRGCKHLEEILLLCGCIFSTSKRRNIELTVEKNRIPSCVVDAENDPTDPQEIITTNDWSKNTVDVASKITEDKKAVVSKKYDHGFRIFIPKIIASSIPPPTLLPWMGEGIFYD